MNHPELSVSKSPSFFLLRLGLALLVIFALLAFDAHGQTQRSVPGVPTHVTHVLGLENVRRNLSGELSIDGGDLHFQRDGSVSARVRLASIQHIFLGEQDRQVGGLPMTLGKAAVPFAGGRLVSLFSHKKYDSLVIEYLDNTGGFHGLIFRVAKGQADALKDALVSHNTQRLQSEDPDSAQSTTIASEPGKFNVQVDRIDPGATTLDPCFSAAIYESLVQDLKTSKRFNAVFRAGDRTAHAASGLLFLKTIVEEYSPGSETKRAVTTVAGATKLKVRVQLVTRDGHVVLERAVAGNVRFVGDNLRATSKLANNTAKILKGSALPPPGSADTPTGN